MLSCDNTLPAFGGLCGDHDGALPIVIIAPEDGAQEVDHKNRCAGLLDWLRRATATDAFCSPHGWLHAKVKIRRSGHHLVINPKSSHDQASDLHSA
jgi:hypothetical protein